MRMQDHGTGTVVGIPAQVPVLDIGAGTGRNALPLAREGFPVDAVELAPALVEILTRDANAENLPVRIVQADAVAESMDVHTAHYKLVFLSEVIASHIRDVPSCRTIFEEAAAALALEACWLSTPLSLRRSTSPTHWRASFSGFLERGLHLQRHDGGYGRLPFELVSDESVHDFERDHLTPDQWPPTGWFEDWAHGLDLFDLPRGKAPLDLRWLVYRKV
jgi:SAM-dependent methyltransferase